MAENCSNGFPDAEHFPWHLYAAAQYDDCFTRSFLPSNNGFSEGTVSRELAGHHGEAFQKPINSGGWEGSDDDVDEHQPTRPADKQQHCKNLFAERKRRQKLKDRLFALRSLVPKITKMDRASILGDAIEYVTDLQKQVKDLQEELELELEANGDRVTELEVEIPTDPKQDCSRGQGREPQVEVRALDANELFLTVLCEHRHGGFARLVEAMAALGLQIASVNVTTFRDLVLNVFRVERRNDEVKEEEDEVVEAVQYLRESLLEATRDAPPSCWSDQPAQERGSGGGDQRQDSHGGRSPAVRLRSSPPLHSSPSVVASWLHSC